MARLPWSTVEQLVVFAFLLFPASAVSQAVSGVAPFSTIDQNQFDSVNLANLNIFVNIPLRDKRGPLQPSYSLIDNSHAIINSGSGRGWFIPAATGFRGALFPSNIGWDSPLTWTTGNVPCSNGTQDLTYSNWTFTDASGSVHPFPASLKVDTAGCIASSATGVATDGSGYTLVLSAVSGLSHTLYTRSGNLISVNAYPQTETDTNGNQLSVSYNNNLVWTYQDGLGATLVTETLGTSDTHVWTDTTGNPQTTTVGSTSLTLRTAFGCSGIGEWNPGVIPLPTSISLPDHSSFTIGYEATPGFSGDVTGRLASLGLPTGGSINYTYTGGIHGINCADGTTATLKRTTSDGTWVYTHTPGTPISTTTVLDPAGNETDYTFSNGFQVQRISYQGACCVVPLETVVTCYNLNSTNCASATVNSPITELDAYTTLAGMSTSAVTKTSYDVYGNVTQRSSYDFGGTSPVLNTVITYGTYSSGSCSAISSTINDRPCIVLTSDGSNHQLAKSAFSYDPHGNLTNTYRYITNTNFLSTSATYNPNGTVATSTDANAAQSSYSYTNCGNGNGFYSGGTYPQGLSISSDAWDCNGGVNTLAKDYNGNSTNSTYNDPMFRITQLSDALTNITNLTYTSTTAESSMVFNTTSTNDVLTTLDGLGRTKLLQRKQSPSSTNYDTVQYTYGYDATGFKTTVSQPCVTTGGASCSTPVTTQTRDALGRSLVTIDGANNHVITRVYTGRDVKTTLLAPTGEVAKVIQQEFNGLGQLLSLCRISSATGSGPCGQDIGGTGFLTTYNYNPSGTLASVVYNNQSSTKQTHSFSYDQLGRKLTETYPESGTTTYTWDSSSLCGQHSSPGDVVAINTNNGKYQCFFYDNLHRLTDVSTNNENSTDFCKRFRYDTSANALVAAPSGFPASSNAKGRLIEAETDSCIPAPPGALITDEWFAYDKGGRLTDTWESTPNSGGVYHTQATFAANGALTSSGANGSNSAWTYTLDGEGRLYSGKNSNGVGVSGVVYDASSMPTIITTTAGDTDTFQYDPNTERMQNYTYTLNGNSMSGALTWNANGTLRQLAITDGFFASGTQTCNYGTSTVAGYDELGRLIGANCGSAWTQTFSYDPFNNITKSGSSSWMPGYSQANNQYQNGSTYDGNGNLTYDTFNSYAWNVFNKPATIVAGNSSPTCGTSGTCLTYDAFDRVVEKNVNGTITELFYEPAGKALMSGQTVNERRLPLPGGATVDAVPGLGTIFWHQDWLGTSRFGSFIPNRTVMFDRAFAPYGEIYAKNGGGTQYESFTGDTQDTFAGLFDTSARELHPAQGRWISADPVHAGVNAYAYPTNPLSMVDPSGLEPRFVRRWNKGFGSSCSGTEWSDCETFLSFDDQSTIWGNDIFDAIQGTPGTYLYLDSHGNLGFGFNEDLWSTTHNIIDAYAKGYTQPVSVSIPGGPQNGAAGSYDVKLQLNSVGWGEFVNEGCGCTDGIAADVYKYEEDVMSSINSLPPDLRSAVLSAFNNGVSTDLVDAILASRGFPGFFESLQGELEGIFANDIWPHVTNKSTDYSPPPVPPVVTFPPAPPPVFP